MTRLNKSFSADDLPEDTGGGFEPIPAGDYSVEIEDAEVKNTKAGDGEFIRLKMRVHGPTHENRIIFGNLNIRNPSAKAEQIGRGQLGSIIRALGIDVLEDTDQLIGGQISVRVKISKREGYPDGNEVQMYKAVTGQATQNYAPAPRPSTPAPATRQAAPATASKAPPWAKK